MAARTCAKQQTRRLAIRSSAASGQHGTTAAHYQVRRLAKTLSGTVKGPKRVPLSLRVAARQEIHSGFALGMTERELLKNMRRILYEEGIHSAQPHYFSRDCTQKALRGRFHGRRGKGNAPFSGNGCRVGRQSALWGRIFAIAAWQKGGPVCRTAADGAPISQRATRDY